jgi:hypothetical protein
VRAATVRSLLLGGSFAAIACGVLGLVMPFPQPELPASASASESAPGRTTSPARIDSLVGVVVTRTPFRAARRPAAMPFDPTASTKQTVAAAASTRPLLTLSGVVWGTEPAAIVEGLPGVERPRVVRRGEAVSGIKVTRIDRDRVWLAGLDTVWALRVKEPK